MSKVHLASLCSWWLRGDVSRAPYVQNAAAKRGVGAHSLIESFLTGAPKPKKPLADSVRFFETWLQSRHPERLALADIRVELAMRIDFRTGEGRVDESIKGRNYPRETDPFVVWGTTDLVVYEQGKLVEICDWKTGRTFPKAPGNGQLLSLATALHAATPFDAITTRIVHIGDTVTDSEAIVTSENVREWRERMVSVIAGVPTAEPAPGQHCEKMFCEQFGKCPATAHLRKKDAAA